MDDWTHQRAVVWGTTAGNLFLLPTTASKNTWVITRRRHLLLKLRFPSTCWQFKHQILSVMLLLYRICLWSLFFLSHHTRLTDFPRCISPIWRIDVSDSDVLPKLAQCFFYRCRSCQLVKNTNLTLSWINLRRHLCQTWYLNLSATFCGCAMQMIRCSSPPCRIFGDLAAAKRW